MMKPIFRSIVLFFCSVVLCLHSISQKNALRAGVARIDITPQVPAWLTGYASRKTPAVGILQPIWAKALVVEENPDARIIFITTDLLGLSHEIVEEVFDALHAKYGIRRSQLLLNASHTHSGPMIWPCLDAIYDFSPDDQRKVVLYTQQLARDLIEVADKAIKDLSVAKLYSGHGTADFAVNRRNSIHPNGPVDHDVPVLKVTDDSNRLRAVLFGYACHNTTLVDDNNLINGDYAGFAQSKIEKEHPGATALFLMGCAGDQNPSPRGTAQLAEQHGMELANAVQSVLSGDLHAVRAPIRTDYEKVFLAYQPFELSTYQKDMVGNDIFLQRRTKLMLEAYNKGWSTDRLSYPVQAVRFNDDLTILGLSDEVVVDYSLLYKKLFKGENLYVAGYCSDVQCYIPSKRVLEEGGYEAEESMIYYGQPGPFAGDVEERITKTVYQVMKNIGVQPNLPLAAQQFTKPQEAFIARKLKGTLGTYAFPPRRANGEVDGQRLIKELREIHANTYHWLAWGNNSDLNAFKKFLPLASKAGLQVWITLVPPSESPPFAKDYAEPYRLDYFKWADTLAKLSLQYPNFVAWSIDDFVHNLQLFTKDYTRQMLGKARSINPRLAFIPCAYYEQVTPQFALDFGGLIDGILFPYRNESVIANLEDPSTVEEEIASLRKLFAPGFLIFLDIYATGHSSYGQTTPNYVYEVLMAGIRSADGILIYCHQDPVKYPEKYNVIKRSFAKAN